MKDTLQNDAAFMHDACAVPAVSTPTLFSCQMICRLLKLNGLFVKKSVCKGAITVVSQPRNGSGAFPGASKKFFCCKQLELFPFYATYFFPIEIFLNFRGVVPCLFLIADMKITGSFLGCTMDTDILAHNHIPVFIKPAMAAGTFIQ